MPLIQIQSLDEGTIKLSSGFDSKTGEETIMLTGIQGKRLETKEEFNAFFNLPSEVDMADKTRGLLNFATQMLNYPRIIFFLSKAEAKQLFNALYETGVLDE